MTSTQPEPALLADISLRDGNESCSASFGGEQVVARCFHMLCGHVVSNGKKSSCWIIEKAKIHLSDQGFCNLNQLLHLISHFGECLWKRLKNNVIRTHTNAQAQVLHKRLVFGKSPRRKAGGQLPRALQPDAKLLSPPQSLNWGLPVIPLA